MAVPYLTQMRRAAWSAIDNWPSLTGAFAATWRYEDMGSPPAVDLVPSIHQLPCLSLRTTSAETPWATNQQQMITLALDAELWTPGWNLLPGERLWQEIARALHQSAPPDAATYVDAASEPITIVAPAAALLGTKDSGAPPMTKWAWQIVLRKRWNPRQDKEHLE